jgi:hypothetical protein
MLKPNDWNMSTTDWPKPDIICWNMPPSPADMLLNSDSMTLQRPENIVEPMDDVPVT